MSYNEPVDGSIRRFLGSDESDPYIQLAMEREADVRCRSGYKGDEYPLSFGSEGHNYQVRQILARSLEEDAETGERKRVFVVVTHEGQKFRLIHSEATDAWHCSNVTTD